MDASSIALDLLHHCIISDIVLECIAKADGPRHAACWDIIADCHRTGSHSFNQSHLLPMSCLMFGPLPHMHACLFLIKSY